MANFLSQDEHPTLTSRWDDALIFASEIHIKQIRKDENKTPYIAHLIQVAGLVLEAGGDEEESIAALLHDSIEDVECGIEVIEDKFGSLVAFIVSELSEDKSIKNKLERKMAYVKQIKNANMSVIRVSLADKLHNLRCIDKGQADSLITPDNEKFYIALSEVYLGRIYDSSTQLWKQAREVQYLIDSIW